MLITEQDIRATINSYATDDAESYDALLGQMREVQTHIEHARTYLRAAMSESPLDLIRRADDHLAFALTAWEDDHPADIEHAIFGDPRPHAAITLPHHAISGPPRPFHADDIPF